MENPLTMIDFFAGIGAASLAAESTGKISTIAYIDIDKNAQKVYESHFPNVPIYSDIRDYHPSRGVDIFFGGVPCTGTSAAGSKTGLEHPESKLWFEYLRCIQEGQPKFAVIENPTGLLDRGMGTILQGLSESGYMCEWQTFSASMFGSPQKRERVFIIAYPYSNYRLRFRAQCWSDQIGEVVERQKAVAKYPSFKPSDDGVAVCLPDGLGSVSIGIAKGGRNRNAIRALFGRTIDLNCAIAVIKRVLYLNQVFTK